MTEPNEALIEQAKADRMQIRYGPGIPVRVFMHDGRVIWSKVDDNLADLTADNSDGLLHHVRSVFVPHGQDDPLARLAAEARAKALDEAAGALEADAQLCDCFARSEGECGCGAWSDYKTVPMQRAVEIVRNLKGTDNG